MSDGNEILVFGFAICLLLIVGVVVGTWGVLMTKQEHIITAFDLNTQMVEKSKEIDSALMFYRDQTRLWVEASRKLRQNVAIQYAKGVAGKNQAEREAAMNAEIEEFVFEEERLKGEREIGKEYIRAKTAQLSALQSQAGALKEELRLARTGPQEGP